MSEKGELSTYFKQPEQTAQVREETPVRSKLLTELHELYEAHPLHGEELARRAFYCAWYDGYQNVKIAKTRDKLVANRNLKQGLRYKSRGNILKRNGRDAISMLIKDDPMGTAIPMDSTPASRNSAQIANHILQNSYDRPDLCIMKKKYLAAENAYKMGTGWLKCVWDPFAFFYNPQSKLWEKIGDIAVSCHDDFEIFPDSSAKFWADVKWIFHVYLQDIDIVKKMYPDYDGDIEEFTYDSPDSQRHLYRPNHYLHKTPVIKKQCLVAEYYEKPVLGRDELAEVDKVPENMEEAQAYYGKRVVIANWNHLLSNDINPYHKFGHFLSLPFVPLFWFSSSSKLHGDSPLREQIPRQYEYSKINSIIGESAFFHGIPRISVARGSGMIGRKIDDDPRTIVETADGKMNVARPPSLPNYISQQRDFVSMEAQRDANTGSMAFGELPTGFSGSSGSALRQLMSRQLGRYAPEVEDLKISTKILGLLILNNYRFNVEQKRFINICGPDKRYKIISYQKSDLQVSLDLMMAATSAYRNSPAAKAELALNLSDRGTIQAAYAGDPSAIMLMNILEFGDINEITRRHNLQRDKAEWVIEKIIKGKEVPPIYPFDNHFIHLEALQLVFANPTFEDDHSDAVKTALAERAKIHMDAILEAQRQKAQAENPPPPGGPDGGQGPPPPQPQGTEQSVDAVQQGGSVTPVFGGT